MQRPFDRRKVLLAGSICFLLILACSSLGTMPGEQGTNLAGDLGIDRDNSLFLAGGQPRTLDPATTLQGASGPVGSIFSGLVALNTDLQVVPDLAAGWDVSDDGTRYTFHLHPGATFHDGRPINAQDVIFSWERAARPSTESDTADTYLGDIVGFEAAASGQGDSISGLKAIDDHTLEVQIDAPKPYFLSKLTYPVTYVVDSSNVDKPGWERKPNGSGPFKLLEWTDDELLILERNEAYAPGPATLDHVVLFLGAGIPLSMYENDEIDIVGIGGGTLERVQDPNNPFFSDLQMAVDMCTTYIGFNTREAPFDDPRVRQAFTQALDRQKLIDGLFRGNALPAVGPLPPGMPAYSGDVNDSPFDPSRAKELLIEAGYDTPSDLPPLTFTTAGYGDVSGFVTAAITMWQENLEFTVEPQMLDPYAYWDELYAGNAGSIFSSGWCADYPDPENFLDVLFHSQSVQNHGGYSSDEVDALLEAARVQPDVSQRMALYKQIEQLIVEDAPAVFVSHGLSAVLVKPWVEDYVLLPIGVAQWHRISLAK